MLDQLSPLSKRHVISLEVFRPKQGADMNTAKAIRLQLATVFFQYFSFRCIKRWLGHGLLFTLRQ